MDRGRSIRELGDTLSWYDLHVFLRHLPPRSAFKSHVDPQGVWRDHELLLLAKLVDAVRGDPAESLLQHLMGDVEPEAPVAPPAPASTTPIRDELAARKAAYAAAA